MGKLTKLQGNRYVLVLNLEGEDKETKDSVTRMANDYIGYFGIPNDKCFSTRPRDVKDSNFQAPTGNSFGNCTLHDKLYICGHGSPTKCGMYSADGVAKILRKAGMTRIGLVTF